MKHTRTAALVAAALVLGLIVGNVASGIAAPSKAASTTATTAGSCGLGLGPVMRNAGARLADVVAKATGLSLDEVYAERAAGKSFADIAESKGVSASKVVDEAIKVRGEVLAELVRAGQLTQEQADAALERMRTRLQQRLTSAQPCSGGCGGGFGAGRGARGGRGGGRGMGSGCW